MKSTNIIVKNVHIHNLNIEQLEIPLNKFVVITGSSGSGKTSLVYDTIAKEAENRFSGIQATLQSNSVLHQPEILGLTPIKALNQKFDYFNKRLKFGDFIDIYKYLHVLYGYFGNHTSNGESIRPYTSEDIYQQAFELPRLPEDVLQQRGYSKRYNYTFPLHFLLLPGAVYYSPEQVAQLTANEIKAANRTNFELIRTHMFKTYDYVLINKHWIVDFEDLPYELDDFDEYIHSVDICFYTIDKDHRITTELKTKLQESITKEQEYFDEIISLGLANKIGVDDIFKKFGIKSKLKITKANNLAYTKAQLNEIRTQFQAYIYLYNPIDPTQGTTYNLELYLKVAPSTPTKKPSKKASTTAKKTKHTAANTTQAQLTTASQDNITSSVTPEPETDLDEVSVAVNDEPEIVINIDDLGPITQDDTNIKVDFTNPNIFSTRYSKLRCSTCNGLGYIPNPDTELDEIECPDCHGAGLQAMLRELELFGHRYQDLIKLPIRKILEVFKTAQSQLPTTNVALNATDSIQQLKTNLITNVIKHLQHYVDIGLGYIQLNRQANSLSGGEIQRVNLVRIINSNTQNVTYILDEPSIGLHPNDNKALLDKLYQLVALGNSVIVVEHDPEFIKHADHLIVLDHGQVLYQGSVANFYHTNFKLARFLKHQIFISQQISQDNISYYQQLVQTERETITQDSLSNILINTEFTNPDTLKPDYLQKYQPQAYQALSPLYAFDQTAYDKALRLSFVNVHYNYFKNCNITLKRGLINIITGVSGSGKSTFAKKVLFNSVADCLKNYKGKRISKAYLQQHYKIDNILGLVNREQTNFSQIIFASHRPENTKIDLLNYFNIIDDLATIFADAAAIQKIKQKVTPKYFKLNSHKNPFACGLCHGKRELTVKFDSNYSETISCYECNGSGFNQAAQAIQLKYDKFSKVAKSINDFYNMNVDDAYDFMLKYHGKYPTTTCKQVITKLAMLKRFRLGKLILGARVNKFSGGELQRLYLARELIKYPKTVAHKGMLIILDEPTTGLHFDDVQSLLDFLVELKQMGHTIVVIEHSPEFIYNADHLIELGPGPDEEGGQVIFEGSIQQVLTNYYQQLAQFSNDNIIQQFTTPMTKYLGEYDQQFKHYLDQI